MNVVRFTASAEEDLIGIWLYTHETWGAKQADDYQNKIIACCQFLADKKLRGKSITGMDHTKLRRCEHHLIFFTADQEGLVILAVLHERMDILERLRNRL